MEKYFVRKAVECSCVVFQVVNRETECVAFYDKDEKIANIVSNRWNNIYNGNNKKGGFGNRILWRNLQMVVLQK